MKLIKVRNWREKTSVGEVHGSERLLEDLELRETEVLRRKWDTPWAETQDFWVTSLISLLLYHEKGK